MQIDFAAAFVPAATADPAKELSKGKDGGPAFPDLELGDGKEVDAVVDQAIALAAAVPTPPPLSPPPEPSTKLKTENHAEAEEPQTTSGSNQLDGAEKSPTGPRIAAHVPVPGVTSRTARQPQAFLQGDSPAEVRIAEAVKDLISGAQGAIATDAGDTVTGLTPTTSVGPKPDLETGSQGLTQDEISLPRTSAHPGTGIQREVDPSSRPAERTGADVPLATEDPVIDRIPPRTNAWGGKSDPFILSEERSPDESAQPDSIDNAHPRAQAWPVTVASPRIGPMTRAHGDSPDQASASLIADVRKRLKSLVESVRMPAAKVASVLKAIAVGDEKVGIPESLRDFAEKAKALLDEIRASSGRPSGRPLVSANGIDLAPINEKVKSILTNRSVAEKIVTPKAIEGDDREDEAVAPAPTTHAQRPEASARPQSTKNEPAVSSAVIDRVIERVQELLESAKPRSVSLRLDPPELGSIELTVKTTGHRVETHIVASSSDVRALLESNRDQLVQALQHRGLELGQMFVGSHGGGKRDAEARQWTELRRLLQPDSVEGAIRISSRPLLRLSTSALDVSV